MKSLSDRIISHLALLASIVLGIAGQLLMKGAALHSAGMDLFGLVSMQTVLALAVYGIGVLCWMLALRRVNLGVAYSVSSLNYVGIFLGSYFFFGEVVTLPRLVGVAFILAGVLLIVIRAQPASGRSA